MCNEAEGFACATADVSAFPGSDNRVTPVAAGSASWRTSNSHGQYLSTDEINQASPVAPDTSDKESNSRLVTSALSGCFAASVRHPEVDVTDAQSSGSHN